MEVLQQLGIKKSLLYTCIKRNGTVARRFSSFPFWWKSRFNFFALLEGSSRATLSSANAYFLAAFQGRRHKLGRRVFFCFFSVAFIGAVDSAVMYRRSACSLLRLRGWGDEGDRQDLWSRGLLYCGDAAGKSNLRCGW
jgi:hypothetical protein